MEEIRENEVFEIGPILYSDNRPVGWVYDKYNKFENHIDFDIHYDYEGSILLDFYVDGEI